jgi:hypothetical protein
VHGIAQRAAARPEEAFEQNDCQGQHQRECGHDHEHRGEANPQIEKIGGSVAQAVIRRLRQSKVRQNADVQRVQFHGTGGGRAVIRTGVARRAKEHPRLHRETGAQRRFPPGSVHSIPVAQG